MKFLKYEAQKFTIDYSKGKQRIINLELKLKYIERILNFEEKRKL